MSYEHHFREIEIQGILIHGRKIDYLDVIIFKKFLLLIFRLESTVRAIGRMMF